MVFWAGLSGEKWMAQEGGLAFEAFESEAYDQSEGVHSSEIPFGASAFLLIFSLFLLISSSFPVILAHFRCKMAEQRP